MTERIDHVKEAEQMLGYSAVTQDAEAIGHALLALVEQQRIANLIALGETSELVRDADEWKAQRVMRADVREGLGL